MNEEQSHLVPYLKGHVREPGELSVTESPEEPKKDSFLWCLSLVLDLGKDF